MMKRHEKIKEDSSNSRIKLRRVGAENKDIVRGRIESCGRTERKEAAKMEDHLRVFLVHKMLQISARLRASGPRNRENF
jgi:hypothetical protein